MNRPIHEYPAFEEVLSRDRFATYLSWAGNDRFRAMELYALNTALCEALYTPLHVLEVILRNRIDQVMSAVHGSNWYDQPEARRNRKQDEMLAKARRDIADSRNAETPGRVIASLTFGYWTAMVGREYENLWQQTLKSIARRENGRGLRRTDLSEPLNKIRRLRNRIAHHEPILHHNPHSDHETILQVTGWLSPVAAQWCSDHSRFNSAYPQHGLGLETM